MLFSRDLDVDTRAGLRRRWNCDAANPASLFRRGRNVLREANRGNRTTQGDRANAQEL
jgi:hypothetical protein